MNLNALINFYLPEENVSKMKSKLVASLYENLSNPALSEANKYSLIDSIITLAGSEEELSLLIRWLKDGKATTEEK